MATCSVRSVRLMSRAVPAAALLALLLAAGGCGAGRTVYDGTFYNGADQPLVVTFADAAAPPAGLAPQAAQRALAPGASHRWTSEAPCVQVIARTEAGDLLYDRQIDYPEYLAYPERSGAEPATRRFVLAADNVYEIPKRYQTNWRDHLPEIRQRGAYLPPCLPSRSAGQ